MDKWTIRAEKAMYDALWRDETCLIYEFPAHIPDALPTPEEIARRIPNPVGYGTGMEDSMINGGTLLDAYVSVYERTGRDIPRAHLIAHGMLNCAENGRDGYLPRSLSPYDGHSHYIDSSIDQYTMFVSGLYRFAMSGMATAQETDRICAAFRRIADRAAGNVREENGWDMLREDGGPSLVTRMRGNSIGPHGWCRLPMLYAAAYRLSGRAEYNTFYRDTIGEALDRSLPLDRVWHLYALQQAASALTVIRDVYPGTASRTDRILAACCAQAEERVAETRDGIAAKAYLLDTVPFVPFRCLPTRPTAGNGLFGDMPNLTHIHADTEAFFLMQDAANITLIHLLAGQRVPDDARELYYSARDRIGTDDIRRAHIVHFLAAALRMED